MNVTMSEISIEIENGCNNVQLQHSHALQTNGQNSDSVNNNVNMNEMIASGNNFDQTINNVDSNIEESVEMKLEQETGLQNNETANETQSNMHMDFDTHVEDVLVTDDIETKPKRDDCMV